MQDEGELVLKGCYGYTMSHDWLQLWADVGAPSMDAST